MNRTIILVALFYFASNNTLNADLIDWQNEVTGAGTTAAATHFSTVDGSNPLNFDVGALVGNRTYEFIVNADTLGSAQTLLGDVASSQSIRFELAGENSHGVSISGNPDTSFGVAPAANSDVHLAFVQGAFSTDLYVDGVFQSSVAALFTLDGVVGLGATRTTTGGFTDNLSGSILGFASYDSALSAAEVATHASAFSASAVPEPASLGIFSLAGLGLLYRRRR